jgi:hypothetical protein
MFSKIYDTLPEIDLGLEEHVESRWITIEEALQMPLMIGGKEVLEFYTQTSINK